MRLRDRITAVLVVLAMAFAVFAIGGGPRWAALTSAALSAASAIPFLTSSRVLVKISPLLWFLVAALLLTILQVLPLPELIAGLLSPHKHQLLAENAQALGTSAPGWYALSYDPSATLLEGAKLAGYLAFAYACIRLSASTQGRRLLFTAVVCIGATAAVIALIHHALGARVLYGLYEPREAWPPFLAPFLNPNHFAGFLALVTPLALALALNARGALRAVWAGAAVLCAATALLTESRGGAIALATGLVVSAAVYVAQLKVRNRPERAKTPVTVIVSAVIVGLCILTLLAVFTGSGIARQLAGTSMDQLNQPGDKLSAWKASRTLVHQHPTTGVGRGAFEPAFTRIQPSVKTFSHLENEYLQAVVDWGIPGAAALAVLLLLTLIQAGHRWRAGPLEVGAIGALTGVAIHAFVDFALELPGAALPVLAVASTLLPATMTRERDRRLVWLLRAPAAIAVAGMVLLSALPTGDPADADAALLETRLAGTDLDAERVLLEVDRAVARHPSDYMPFAIGARALFQRRDARAVVLVNRALTLNPSHSGIHHLAARMLVAGKEMDQAAIEYSLAIEAAPLGQDLIAEVMATYDDPELAARAVPLDHRRAAIFIAFMRKFKRGDVALVYGERLQASPARNAQVDATLSEIARELKRGDLALQLAARGYAEHDSAINAIAYARALHEAHRSDDAERILQQAGDVANRRAADREFVQILALRAEIQYERGDYEGTRATLQLLVGRATTDRRALVRAHRKLAEVEEKLGNPNRAAWERKRAQEYE